MGWGKLFGDLAKDYIRENGVKGTMEDLGSLASGIRGFFSSDDDDSSDDENIWEPYNEFLEQENYQAAMNYVKNVYQGVDKDYIYNYMLGNAMLQLALAEGNASTATKAKNHLQSARNAAPSGTEDYDVIKQRLKEAEEAIDIIRRNEAFRASWDNTLKRVKKLKNNNKFEEAAKTLLDHYKQYENGQLDCYYWMEMAEIHYDAHMMGDPSKTEKEFDKFLKALDNASKDADDASVIERINNMRDWQKKVSQKPVETPTPSVAANSDAEKEYLDEVKACLADDGVISERERRLLNKLSKSLGISEERAAELEKQCQGNGLNDQELEYLEELKACMEDGIITEKEERLLNRLRKSLGISEERDAEIRKMIKA